MGNAEHHIANELIRSAIRILMRKRGTRYKDLAKFLGVSESTVKRVVTKDDLSIDRVEKICGFFELSFFELVEIAKVAHQPVSSLDEDQELYLAAHPNVARYFWLLLNGLTGEAIAKRYDLTDAKAKFYRSTLQDIGILKRTPDGGLRLSVQWPIGFKRNGPMYKLLAQDTFGLFLKHVLKKAEKSTTPERDDFMVNLLPLVLNKTSLHECRKELTSVVEKWVKISRLQLATEPDSRLEISTLMVALDQYDAVGEILGPL